MSTTYTNKEINELIRYFNILRPGQFFRCSACSQLFDRPDFYYTGSKIGLPCCPNCGKILSLPKYEKRLEFFKHLNKNPSNIKEYQRRPKRKDFRGGEEDD